MRISLVSFLIFLCVFYGECESTFKAKKVFQKFYYIQKLYPGRDFIASMKYQSEMKLAYFTLNKNMLFYSESFNKKNQVVDSLSIAKIADKNFDNAKVGKCCYNIIYHNFQKGINRRKTSQSRVKANGIMNILDSNYCLEIIVPNETRWRLCSNKMNSIRKLHMQIAYNIMLLNNKKKTPALAVTFLKNFKASEYEANIDFDWDTQLKWKDRCRSKFLQSPVNVAKPHILLNLQKDFSFTYNFYEVYPIVQRRFNEAIITFSNHPGIVQVSLGNKQILYLPKYVSFRFPGEHPFEGKRYNGEMLIHMKELHPDKKRRQTQGMVWTVPFENSRENPNFSPLESLGMDFWKFSLHHNNQHKPTDFISQQRLVFSLTDIFNQISTSGSKFYYYLGSETTPPCSEHVFHVIIEKPIKISNCQLKVLRENSLFVNGFRQIHSRLTQNINNRNIYTVDKLINNPSVESSIPKEFYDLALELYGIPLLQEKLSTVDRLKALNALKKGLKKGAISKYNKKGLKIVRDGVALKDELYGDYDAYDPNNLDPEYQKKFGKRGKYAKYGKYGKLFGRGIGSGRGHWHTGAGGNGTLSGDIDSELNC